MTSKSMTPPPARSRPSSEPWKPLAYMKRAVKFLLEQAAAALFLDPGLGKTSITLAAIKLLMKLGLAQKTLVIAPLRVAHSTWPAEAAKWKDFNHLRVVVLHGKDKDELLATDADVYVINPEGLEWLLKPAKGKNRKGKTTVKVSIKDFKKLGFDILVVDELTKFKNHQSVRFKMLSQVLGTFGRRWGLTGSPAANGLLGLFGQMYIIDQGRSLGNYITKYRAEFFVPGHDGFSWHLQDDGEERIYERLSPVVLRMAAKDYLDLPKLIENVIRIDLPDDVMGTYLQLEDDLLTEIAGRTVTAKNVGVSLGKCRQVTGGAIYHERALGELEIRKRDKKRDWTLVHETKLDALEELIEELQGAPTLVVYEFQHELERIQERLKKSLGIDAPYIGKGVSSAEGKRLEAAWNASELPVLIVNAQSVAHGLNMQKSGQHIIWYTLTWDRELYEQLVARLLRQGSVNTRIFSHLLIARGTVDEVVLGSSKAKGRGQQALFDGLQLLQRSRPRRRMNGRTRV